MMARSWPRAGRGSTCWVSNRSRNCSTFPFSTSWRSAVSPSLPNHGRQHRGVPLERGRQHEELVPHRRVLARVALVLGLGPDQGGRRVGPPFRLAPPHRHAPERHRHPFLERVVRELVHQLPVHVPHLEAVTEAVRGDEIGIRLVDDAHEHVLTVRRGIEGADHPGVAQALAFSAQVHANELAGGVIVEQILVVRVLEQVLIGAGLRLLPAGLLHDRAAGHLGLGGLGAAVLGDHQRDQRLAVR